MGCRYAISHLPCSRTRNLYSDYEPYVQRWSAEEFCNTALTLCHMTDRMMYTYLDKLQRQFVTQGGIKERMYAARTGYRKEQDRISAAIKAENACLKAENERLKAENEKLRVEIGRLRAGRSASTQGD